MRWDFFERYMLALLKSVVKLTSWERLPQLAKPIHRILWLSLPRRRAITIYNLQNALELSEREAVLLGQQVFHHVSLTALEFLKLDDLPTKNILKLVSVQGLSSAKSAWHNFRKLIIVTGHLGNFELMGARLAQEFPLWVIARPQRPSAWQVIKRIRQKFGMKVMNKFGSVREALRILRQGEVLGMLADQHASDQTNSVIVPIFRRPASVFKTPALLAARTKAHLVFGYDTRLPDGKHKITLLPPKEVNEGEVEDAIKWLCRQLEQAILKAPDQWWWLHDRWKVARQNKNRNLPL